MRKIKIIFILALIFIIVFLISWFIIESEKRTVLKEPQKPSLFSERAVTFSIIGGGQEFPDFTKEAIVDPFRVREGEKQTFSIWVKDPLGVEKLTGKIKTDKGEEIIKFNLVEGTHKEGRWVASWITKDILAQPSYSIIFQAINKEGKENEAPLHWYAEK